MRRMPGPTRRNAAWTVAALLWVVSTVAAQPQGARIGYVCPAGGQRGDTFMIVIGGQQLNGVEIACINGPGVTAKVIELVKTLNPRQISALRNSLAALQKATPTIEIIDEIADIRKKLATKTPTSPAIADTLIVQVTIAADAAPGQRELRLVTPTGLTNPLMFSVGILPEVSKDWPKASFEVEVLRAAGEPVPLPEPTAGPISIQLPAVVNGQILPGSTDRYRFQARRGQRIVVATEARKLIPYIADAVPGWFEAAVAIRDANGRELSYADHYRFGPDPVLYCEIPHDGPYFLEIRDSLYRGREDFVYRITIGELPFITGIFPLGCRTGDSATFELTGWNLPSHRITQDAKNLAPGLHILSAFKAGQSGSYVPVAVNDIPEILATQPHHSRANAQAITLPVIVNGRIDSPDPWTVFAFQARAGDEVVAEVDARHLGSPLDSVLMLTDANGVQLAFNDDHEDEGAGLETHHADSYIRAKLPAAGTYFLHLGDIQQQHGPEYAYRLRVSAPRPDFELRVAPSAVNLRAGENIPAAVYALRKDGFAGDIALSLKDAPPGLILSGPWVPASQNRAWVTLTPLATAPNGRIALNLQGRATIDGKEVVRQAVPAEDMMQAFAYRHLVPSQELDATVPPRDGSRPAIKVACLGPVAIHPGTTACVQVDMPEGATGPVQFELVDPPAGIAVQSVANAGEPLKLALTCDPNIVKPGFKGNLIANAFIMVEQPPPSPDSPERTPRPRRAKSTTQKAPEAPNRHALITDSQDSDFDMQDMEEWLMQEAGTPETASSKPATPASKPAPTQSKPSPTPRPVPAEPPPPRKTPLGMLPAISFEVVEP